MMEDWAEYQEQEKKHERCALRRIVVSIGLAVIVGLGLFFGFQKVVFADEVRTADGQYGYSRSQAPCEDADILTHLVKMGAAEMLKDFKKGTLTYEGKEFRSCWIEVDGTVYSVDSEGAPFQPIPVRAFKKTGTDA